MGCLGNCGYEVGKLAHYFHDTLISCSFHWIFPHRAVGRFSLKTLAMEYWRLSPSLSIVRLRHGHHNDVIISAMASQINSLTIVYSTVYSRRRSRKTPKLRVTGLCEGNSPVTGEFPAQKASNAENVSIWWRHHGAVDSAVPSHGCWDASGRQPLAFCSAACSG